MFLGLEREVALALLYYKLHEQSDVFTRRVGHVNTHIDMPLVEQAYDEAQSSYIFRCAYSDEPDERRHLAHVMYWIAELKPVTIIPPRTIQSTLKHAASLVSQKLYGPGVHVNEAAESDYDRAAARYAAMAKFPVSEFIALQILSNTFESKCISTIEKEDDAERQELRKRHLEHFTGIFQKKLILKLAKSLRFHVFTPRSFATMADSLFSFDGH